MGSGALVTIAGDDEEAGKGDVGVTGEASPSPRSDGKDDEADTLRFASLGLSGPSSTDRRKEVSKPDCNLGEVYPENDSTRKRGVLSEYVGEREGKEELTVSLLP